MVDVFKGRHQPALFYGENKEEESLRLLPVGLFFLGFFGSLCFFCGLAFGRCLLF